MRSSCHVMIAILFFMCATLSLISQAQNSPQDYLEVHNKARADVGVGPLTWNDTLEAYAQDYANKRIGDCKLEHSMGPYGENIAVGYADYKGVEASKLWLAEKPFYDPNTGKCVKDECLHYTQMVWRDTAQLGCARAKCTNGWMFVICNYYPYGNVIGDKPY